MCMKRKRFVNGPKIRSNLAHNGSAPKAAIIKRAVSKGLMNEGGIPKNNIDLAVQRT